jgi:hypothetical protein
LAGAASLAPDESEPESAFSAGPVGSAAIAIEAVDRTAAATSAESRDFIVVVSLDRTTLSRCETSVRMNRSGRPFWLELNIDILRAANINEERRDR